MGEVLFFVALLAVVCVVLGLGFLMGYSYAASEEFSRGHTEATAEAAAWADLEAKVHKEALIAAYRDGYRDGVSAERTGLLEAIRERAEGAQ